MTENKKSTRSLGIGTASGNAPAPKYIKSYESLNAPTRQFNGSQDAPTTNSKSRQVSSKITAND